MRDHAKRQLLLALRARETFFEPLRLPFTHRTTVYHSKTYQSVSRRAVSGAGRNTVILKQAGDRLPIVVRTNQEVNIMSRIVTKNGAVRQEQVTPPSPNRDNGETGQTAAPSSHGDKAETGQTAAPSCHGDSGRDSRGRFTKGNPGGPGNPFARKAAALRAALCNRVTEQDIEELAQQLLDRAKSGDLAAMKLLFAYVIGRPQVVVNPDTLDVQEWQLHQESATRSADVHNVLTGVPLPVACEIARSAVPVLAQETAKSLAQALGAEPAGDQTEEKSAAPHNGMAGQQPGATSPMSDRDEAELLQILASLTPESGLPLPPNRVRGGARRGSQPGNIAQPDLRRPGLRGAVNADDLPADKPAGV